MFNKLRISFKNFYQNLGSADVRYLRKWLIISILIGIIAGAAFNIILSRH